MPQARVPASMLLTVVNKEQLKLNFQSANELALLRLNENGLRDESDCAIMLTNM